MVRERNITRLSIFLGLILAVIWSVATGGTLAYADISGSALTGVSPVPLPVGTFDITFTVHFPVSIDGEFMDRFDVTVPAGWTINSVTHTNGDSFCPDTIEGNNGQTIYWQSNATLPSGCGAWSGDNSPYTFIANVTIPSCPAGPVSLPWNIAGDNYVFANPPHTTSGSFPVALACQPTAPFAPTDVKAVPGDGQAMISFSPGYNGGSPITGYTVTASPGSITKTGSFSPIVVTGLTNGTEYTFVVSATNAIGTGPVSDPSNIVTPWPGLIGSGDVPKDIPDNNPTGVASTLTIAPAACSNIADLNVAVNISHPWIGDLIVNLTHNDTGTSAVIIDRPGFPASDFGCEGGGIIDVVLDDAATNPVENSSCVLDFRGTFSPNNPLSVFNGEDAAGTWTLTVSDNAPGDFGSLNSWGLILSCGATHSLTVSKLGAGTGTVTSNPAGINCGSTCSIEFPLNQKVMLSATPSTGGSIFSGWSGDPDCADGIVTMSTEKSCTATFDLCNSASIAKIGSSALFGSIYDAYVGAAPTDTIKVIASNQQEDLVFSGKNLALQGGYDCDFTEPPTSFTTITGSITISGGSVSIGGIRIQ